MIYVNPKNGESYIDGIDVRFTKETVADIKTSKAHRLTLKGLREFIDKMQDMPDDTPVLYENISEYLLTNDTGWTITPLLWETFDNEKQYSPAISAWQIFRTVDINGDVAIMLTAHY